MESLSKKNEKSKNIKKYLELYNKNIRKTHIIIYIICMLVFLMVVNSYISNIDVTNILTGNANISISSLFSIIFKEKLVMIFLMIFAGITPFIFLPLIGVVSSYNLAVCVGSLFILNSSTIWIILSCIGSIIQMFGFSLAISIGTYYCILATKKYRYNFKGGITFSDIKKTLYKSTNNKQKFDNEMQKENERNQKREKLNVKIPYISILIFGIISFIITTIGTIICRF